MNTGILCGLDLGLDLNELPNFNLLQWKNNSNVMSLQNKSVIPAYHLYLTKGLSHIIRKRDHSIPSSKSHICQLLVVPSLVSKSTQETKSLFIRTVLKSFAKFDLSNICCSLPLATKPITSSYENRLVRHDFHFIKSH